MNESSPGCFGGGPGMLSVNSRTFPLSTGHMLAEKSYILTAMATMGARSSVTDFQVNVFDADPPSVSVLYVPFNSVSNDSNLLVINM